MQDIWEFKDYQYPVYPTEKNVDMLKTLILASSNENSYVMDFFCGSGTTLVAAQELNRNWIGIDKSIHAINATKNKLKNIQTDMFLNTNYSYIEEEYEEQELINEDVFSYIGK